MGLPFMMENFVKCGILQQLIHWIYGLMDSSPLFNILRAQLRPHPCLVSSSAAGAIGNEKRFAFNPDLGGPKKGVLEAKSTRSDLAELGIKCSCSALQRNAEEAIGPFHPSLVVSAARLLEPGTFPLFPFPRAILRRHRRSLGGFIRQRWNRRPRTSWRALTRQWDKPWQMGGTP
jgi:hypothetical protein